MPLKDNSIHMHLLTELDDGTSKDFPIEDKSIQAMVSIKGKEAGAKAVDFVPVGDTGSASEYSFTIPEDLADGELFTVVVPKLTIGGQRQNFSFKIRRAVDDQAEDASSAQGDTQESSE